MLLQQHAFAARSEFFVASYLLAHGLFHERLHAAGADGVTEPLGVDPGVVDLVVNRYESARRELVSLHDVSLRNADVCDLVAAVRESDVKAQALIGALTEEQAREPSGLPGWSRGHVVTHMSRNADALADLLPACRAANRGRCIQGGRMRAMLQSKRAQIARLNCWPSTTASRERGWSTRCARSRQIDWTHRCRGANL